MSTICLKVIKRISLSTSIGSTPRVSISRRFDDKYLPGQSTDQRLESWRFDMQNEIGCHLSGTFGLNRINGNFHISFHSFMMVYMNAKKQYYDLFLKMNLSYEIQTLIFGDTNENLHVSEVRKLISDMELEEQLFENFIDHQRNSYSSFLAGFWFELFPYRLIDHRTGVNFKSLQHSFNRKIKVRLKRKSYPTR